ncbi:MULTISPECIES: 2Fe-2S iron-sulfur cluster-binding protein [unclassified Micromonospora]|uniref:2Fe-2S iron-sulfur cluster-binding protein n=1 Tax=unclassified Micromonospora TaxID=2617518 RepID=UPI003330B849
MTVTVVVLPTGLTVPVANGETILAAFSRAGYTHTVGCRRGGCGMCKVDLRAGSVRYDDVVAESVLAAEERAAGTCLTCRAVPCGDVVVELRQDRLRRTNPFLPRTPGPA